MEQNTQRSNLFIKVLGSATLVGLIAVVTLLWSIYSSHSAELAMEKQLANQATQIAKQDIQISLNAEQNHLLSEQATIETQKVNIEAQLRTPIPINSTDFAPTATALAFQSIQVEATRQAIETKQKQIEATQTAIAQPLPTLSSPNLPAQIDMGCVGREKGATINGNSVPVSDWQSDCAYRPGVSTGTTILLTTWGVI